MAAFFSFGNKPDPEGREKVHKVLNEILEFASTGNNLRFLEMAKDHYFAKVGRIYEDDSDFERWMNTFLEWFVFDFRSDAMGSGTVFTNYIKKNRDRFSSDELLFRMTLAKHLHSVFIVKATREGMIKVSEIVGGKTFWVTNDELFEKTDLLETRLITVGGGHFFSNTYCLHPRVATKLLKDAFRNRRKMGTDSDFFVRLHAMQLKWQRSRQIEIEDIYNFK